MKKVINKIIFVFLSFSFLVTSNVALAQIVNEVDPNDTPDEATLILECETTKQDVWNNMTNPASSKIISGSISSVDDVDWYKIYLTNKTKRYLSIFSNSVIANDTAYQVFDSYLAPITDEIIYNNANGTNIVDPYELNIINPDYYYIKVTTKASGGAYKFLVGGVFYAYKTFKFLPGQPIGIRVGETQSTATFNTLNASEIPINAEVAIFRVSETGYSGKISNDKMYIKLNSKTTWNEMTSTNSYSYGPNGGIKAVNSWDLKITGTVSGTSPYIRSYEIYLDCIYPVISLN